MTKRNRRTIQGKGALAALKGDKTLAELAQQFDIHPNPITDWKKQLQVRVADVFDAGNATAAAPPVDVKVLHAKIGQLTLKTIPKKRPPPGEGRSRIRSHAGAAA